MDLNDGGCDNTSTQTTNDDHETGPILSKSSLILCEGMKYCRAASVTFTPPSHLAGQNLSGVSLNSLSEAPSIGTMVLASRNPRLTSDSYQMYCCKTVELRTYRHD